MLVLQLMVKRLSAKDIYQTLAHGAHAQETGDVPIYIKLSFHCKFLAKFSIKFQKSCTKFTNI